MKKKFRIKQEKEFREIMQLKNSFANRHLIIYIRHHNQYHHPRVGLSVGKKLGNAVKRNQVKRYLRQAIQGVFAELPPDIDIILIARPQAANLSYYEMEKNLHHVFRLADIWKDKQ